jgi:hypothetical protein
MLFWQVIMRVYAWLDADGMAIEVLLYRQGFTEVCWQHKNKPLHS